MTLEEITDQNRQAVLALHVAPGQERFVSSVEDSIAEAADYPHANPWYRAVFASGDTVATRWVVTGSLQQEFMGIPASGQTIRVEGMNFYRLKDGLVTDLWTQFDGVAMMQQLGAVPA